MRLPVSVRLVLGSGYWLSLVRGEVPRWPRSKLVSVGALGRGVRVHRGNK